MLTNQHKLNGSVCILYRHLLKDIADRMKSDLYILPSSVHEVLLIPASDRTAASDLTDMVRDVNTTQLAQEEILSDHVYYFSRTANRISM